jgi:hypothetical protein
MIREKQTGNGSEGSGRGLQQILLLQNFPGGTEENHKKSKSDSRCTGRDSKWEHPKYIPEALSIQKYEALTYRKI